MTTEVRRELIILYGKAEHVVSVAGDAGVLSSQASRAEALRSVFVSLVANDIQRLSDLVGESNEN